MKKWGIIFIGLFFVIQCDYLSQFKIGSSSSEIIIENKIDFSMPSLIKLHTDDLLLSYSVNDSTAGRIQFKTSNHQGQAWKESKAVINTTWPCGPTHLIQIKDHLILLHFTLYRAEISGSAGIFLVYSYDYGKSFTVPRKISTDILFPCHDSGNMLELQNGKLLIPVSVQRDSALQELGMLSSDDRGETWKYHPFFQHMNIAFENPSWIQLNNGRILCQLESKDHSMIYQTLSEDQGATWSDPVPTQIYGQSAELFLNESGAIFSVFQDDTPSGISCLTSFDFGQSWQNECSVYFEKNYLGLTGVECKANAFRLIAKYSYEDKYLLKQIPFNLIVPRAPKGFSADVKEETIQLRWNKISEAHYYLVYKSVKDSLKAPEARLIVGSTSENSFVDKDMRHGEEYFYGIQSVYGKGPLVETAGGLSALSEIIHIQTKIEEKNEF